MTPFLKMHGLGNDFAVFDGRTRALSLGEGQARAIADRRLGIGCDQVIVIGQAKNGADASMRIYNADGGEVESCGNAARCVARLLMDECDTDSICLDTEGGALACSRAGALVRIDVGMPRFDWREIPLSEERDTGAFDLELTDMRFAPAREAAAASVGNPHCVLFVDDAKAAPVESLGHAIETHPLFPERTNVEFVQVLSPERLRMRVWERGAGVTLACGTGACASMAAAQRRGLCGERVEVVLDGGSLQIDWAGGDSHIFMTGPVALSYRGEIDFEALA
jgi:diaminopimelate epimerase